MTSTTATIKEFAHALSSRRVSSIGMPRPVRWRATTPADYSELPSAIKPPSIMQSAPAAPRCRHLAFNAGSRCRSRRVTLAREEFAVDSAWDRSVTLSLPLRVDQSAPPPKAKCEYSAGGGSIAAARVHGNAAGQACAFGVGKVGSGDGAASSTRSHPRGSFNSPRTLHGGSLFDTPGCARQLLATNTQADPSFHGD
jgi:hypothetical protein